MSSTSFRTHPPRAGEIARLRQTVFRCSPHRLSQTRRAESLRYHSAPFVPGLDAPGASVPPLRLRDFHRLRRARSVSSPFTASIPPPPLRHSSPFRRPGSHVRSALQFHLDSTVRARAGKSVISRLNRLPVRLLPRLSACLLTLRMTERTMLTHRPFRLPASRAVEYTHATMSMHNETSSHAGSEKKDIYNVE